MSLRFHEIAESGHRVLNPFSEEKLDLLGEITRVGENTRLLDLACGKGELLCRWAAAHRITGLGWTSARSSSPRPGSAPPNCG